MNNWKISLDKYLTSCPDDSFGEYVERVCDSFTDDFYDLNEDWIMDYNGTCTKWIYKLLHKDPKEAAQIIQRAFKIFNLTK